MLSRPCPWRDARTLCAARRAAPDLRRRAIAFMSACCRQRLRGAQLLALRFTAPARSVKRYAAVARYALRECARMRVRRQTPNPTHDARAMRDVAS